ncbi:hypothetical protein K456DRAFT_414925 [Colletotrichum gloeosporioides 23]|nr:hypothetical protein K456DRAFT_414925 [Colletotrichum gloeosporioides 23]
MCWVSSSGRSSGEYRPPHTKLDRIDTIARMSTTHEEDNYADDLSLTSTSLRPPAATSCLLTTRTRTNSKITAHVRHPLLGTPHIWAPQNASPL